MSTDAAPRPEPPPEWRAERPATGSYPTVPDPDLFAEHPPRERRVGDGALRRAAERRLAAVVEGMSETFLSLDATWRVTYANRAACQLNGTTRAALVGRDHWQQWPETVGGEVERQYRRAAAERERLLMESERARRDAEAARAEAEATNRAKAQFLATMSHELRTPLNAIGGYTALMDMGIRGPVSDEQRHDLARIQASQRHLLGLINEVLSYAKIETGAVHYDIADVGVDDAFAAAEALVAPQAHAKSLALTVRAGAPGVAVRADAEKLRQVLVNLLSNAVKFTDRGGCIALTCVAGADGVRIAVRDTGIGIPSDHLDAVFEPFVQVRTDLTRTADGTGLGLAISRDLARGMGGDLAVESALGAGSTFTLTLQPAPTPA